MGLTPEERILFDGCRRGDEAAWLALYRAYSADVGTFLNGMLRHTNDVDDLVQRVFLEFLSSLDRFRGDASLRTWLFRIARNLALHEFRSRSRRDHYVQAYAETVGSQSVSPENQVDARQQLHQIQQLLSTLDLPFREVWTLRELAGCTVAETAEVLEIPEPTVRTRHFRARKRMFELLNAAQSNPDPIPTGLKLVQGKGSN